MSTAELRHRWTRAEWSELELDALRHCELIDGDILDMAAMASPHALVTGHIVDRFTRSLPADGQCCGSQTPVVIDDFSEPEPDVWVARVARLDLELGKPQPHELVLVVEVCDTTVRADRRVKLPVYAGGGVPEAWIVDVNEWTIEVQSDPDPVQRHYSTVRVLRQADSIVAPWGTEFAVADLLLAGRRF
jgi:Uma2 family endonuclease